MVLLLTSSQDFSLRDCFKGITGMTSDKKIVLSNDDLLEMFGPLVFPDNESLTISISIESLNSLHRWKEMGIDINFEEFVLLVNVGLLDADFTGKTRLWSTFETD